MPWKECNHMDERLRFVARLLDGEKMAVMCREFGLPTAIRTDNGVPFSSPHALFGLSR